MEDIKSTLLNAGEVLREQYFGFETCLTKEKYDLVTSSDYLIEKLIIDGVKENYPNDSIYSEETGRIEGNSDRCWIIDPIDGTANYVFGVPYFCISICLKIGDDIVEAYVYNPITRELFHSIKDEEKSYLNGRVIYVSKNRDVAECLAVFGFSANYKNINRYYQEWSYIFENAKKGMPLLSPALNICNVARGRTDFFIDFGSSMEGHSAAALILKNAGGNIYNYDFSEWDYKCKGIIATNGKVCLQKCLNR